MKKITQKLTAVIATLMFAMVPLALPTIAGAQSSTPAVEDNLCAGANLDVNDPNCNASGANDTVNSLLADVINIFSLIVGVVSVIMIIIGGLRYITSGGDSNNVSAAKNTILYAIVGLVIVALAQLIVRFVLSRATAIQ